jgi:hypothetical protein
MMAATDPNAARSVTTSVRLTARTTDSASCARGRYADSDRSWIALAPLCSYALYVSR